MRYAALRSPPVQVLGLVDDDPNLRGKRLWNLPVYSTTEAAGVSADAVVLSSDAFEDKLAEAAEPLARVGMRIVRLYTRLSSCRAPELIGAEERQA